MASFQTDPLDVPEELIAVLKDSADGQLRAIVDYTRQLLSEQLPTTGAVDPRRGEEPARVGDHISGQCEDRTGVTEQAMSC